MNYWRRWEIIGCLCAATVLIGIVSSSIRNERRAAMWHDSTVVYAERTKAADAKAAIANARYAEAAVALSQRIDTVEHYTKTYITKWDTVAIPASGWDSETVAAYQTDVSHLARSCNLLVGAARLLKTTCDSSLAAKDSQIAARNGVILAQELVIDKLRPHWWQRCGVGPSYSVIKVGAQILAGPGASVSCKVWP